MRDCAEHRTQCSLAVYCLQVQVAWVGPAAPLLALPLMALAVQLEEVPSATVQRVVAAAQACWVPAAMVQPAQPPQGRARAGLVAAMGPGWALGAAMVVVQGAWWLMLLSRLWVALGPAASSGALGVPSLPPTQRMLERQLQLPHPRPPLPLPLPLRQLPHPRQHPHPHPHPRLPLCHLLPVQLVSPCLTPPAPSPGRLLPG
jgi:hypothetical protein